jgi:hypothetical protein
MITSAAERSAGIRRHLAPRIRPERLDQPLKFPFKRRIVVLPAGEVNRQAGTNLIRFAILPLPERVVEVEGDQRADLRTAILHELLFFGEGFINFVIHPPAFQRAFRGAQQDLVPQTNLAIDLIVDRVAGEQLVLVEPAANTPALQRVVEAAGKGWVGVAVGDDHSGVVDRLGREHCDGLDHAIRTTAVPLQP